MLERNMPLSKKLRLAMLFAFMRHQSSMAPRNKCQPHAYFSSTPLNYFLFTNKRLLVSIYNEHYVCNTTSQGSVF